MGRDNAIEAFHLLGDECRAASNTWITVRDEALRRCENAAVGSLEAKVWANVADEAARMDKRWRDRMAEWRQDATQVANLDRFPRPEAADREGPSDDEQ